MKVIVGSLKTACRPAKLITTRTAVFDAEGTEIDRFVVKVAHGKSMKNNVDESRIIFLVHLIFLPPVLSQPGLPLEDSPSAFPLAQSPEDEAESLQKPAQFV